MRFDLDDDQEALRATVAELVAKECPVDVVRAAEPLGFDAALWRRVAGLGLPTIAVAEEHGGGGAGFVELAVVAEVLGRALAPVPFAEAAAAATLRSELKGQGVPPAEEIATITLHPMADGVARLVPAGAVADVVLARRGDEVLALRPDHHPEPPANLGAMPVADVRTSDGETQVLAVGERATAAHRRAVHRWQVLTAAALAGLGARALELGVEYVRQRRAFGTLIGSFQAVQHRLADDATALAGARLLAYKAAWAQDAGAPDAGELATMAFLFASEAAFTTAGDSLHVHGGYGYTLEYDAQLYFRRAKAWALVAGDRRRAYADLARRCYDRPEA